MLKLLTRIEGKFAVNEANNQGFLLCKDEENKLCLLDHLGNSVVYDNPIHDKYLTIVEAETFDWSDDCSGALNYTQVVGDVAADGQYRPITERPLIQEGKYLDPITGVTYTLGLYPVNCNVISSDITVAPALVFKEGKKVVVLRAMKGINVITHIANHEMLQDSDVYLRLVKL